jgi:hypothetical protein
VAGVNLPNKRGAAYNLPKFLVAPHFFIKRPVLLLRFWTIKSCPGSKVVVIGLVPFIRSNKASLHHELIDRLSLWASCLIKSDS